MTRVRLELPAARDVELDTLLEDLNGAPRLRPFDTPIVEFCATLSAALWAASAATEQPAIRALAFSLRPAAVAAMERAFSTTSGLVRVPRGLVFHIPPTNVDTLFMYSWLYALLTGNRSIVRLSETISTAQAAMLDVVRPLLAADPVLRGQLAVVRYGHDDAITAAISARADVRVVWGGDATVAAIRRVPIDPLGVEIAFPDRTSFAAIDARAYLRLDEAGRQRLAEAFQADSYAFDGLACSSPRLLVWCGDGAESRAASVDFWPRVAAVNEERGYEAPLAARVRSFGFAADTALRLDVDGWLREGTSLAIVRLDGPASVPPNCPGGGVFLETFVPKLAAYAAYVTRRDQTLTHFGIPVEELTDFVHEVGGRGVDRLVRIGQALTFDRYWDGYDLLEAFTRAVRIQPGTARQPG